MRRDEDEPGGAEAALPDLLLGMAALFLAAVAALLPTMRVAAGAGPAADPARLLAQAEILVHGRPAQPFRAAGAGLSGGPQDVLIAPDRILDSPLLAADLRRLRDQGRPVLLIVEPDGHESAFLFEAVAALHGPPTLLQVRLDRACGFARGAVLAACLPSPRADRP